MSRVGWAREMLNLRVGSIVQISFSARCESVHYMTLHFDVSMGAGTVAIVLSTYQTLEVAYTECD